MAGRMKTEFVLAGLLAGSLALGTGCTRAEAEPRPQDLLQQQEEAPQGEEALPPEEEDTLDPSGTGGTGGTGTPQQDEELLDPSGTGGTYDQGTTQEPDMLDEPGTGGAGQDPVRDEDEGVLQPGLDDEGLDSDQGQVDEDTVPPPGTRPLPEESP